MDTYFKIIGIAMIGALLSIVLSKNAKDYTLLLTATVCIVIAIGIGAFINPVITMYDRFRDLIGQPGEWLQTLLKATGLACIGEISASVCNDVGQGGVAKILQYATSAAILWVSIPMIDALLDLVCTILEML